MTRAHGVTWGILNQPDWAGSGEMVIGMVVERDGRWVWQTTALNSRHVDFDTHGDVATCEDAKRAAEEA